MHDTSGETRPTINRRDRDIDRALNLLAIVVIAVVIWNLLDSLTFQFARDTIGNSPSLHDVRAFPSRTDRIIFWVVLAATGVLWLVRMLAKHPRSRRPWLVPFLLFAGVLIHMVSMIVAGVSYVQDDTFMITVWDCPATVDGMTLQRADCRCTERLIDPASWAILDDDTEDKTSGSGIAPTAYEGSTATWSGLPRGSYTFYLIFLIFDDEFPATGEIMMVQGDQYARVKSMTYGNPQGLPYWYSDVMSDAGDADIYFVLPGD